MKTTKIVLAVALAFALAASNSWAMESEICHVLESKTPKTIKETELSHSSIEKHSLEVPLNMVYDYFFIVEVTIKGEKLNFLFDENSLQTAISKEKADLLGVDDRTQVFIGGQSFGGNMMVSDFTKLKSSGLNVDGIIGSSIVDYYNIELDLDHGVLICTPY